MINAGELNCRQALHHLEIVDDGQGGHPEIYAEEPFATVWGKVKTILARKVDEYEQIIPEQQHLIEIRFRSDLLYTDQIRLGARLFEQIAPPVNVDQKNM
jgi:head-tail adaptor